MPAAKAEPKAFIDGGELLQLCEDVIESNFTHGTDCLGYVTALSDFHETFVSLDLVPRQWCWPPEGVSNREMARVVYRHLQNNRAVLDKSAALLGSIALFEAYPCE
jgi:hypothetical protein